MSRNIRLSSGWRFRLGDVADAYYMGFDDRGWRQVAVPHDWAVEHPFDPCWASGTGYLPGGIGWYRGHFTLEEADAAKRVRITFQGVYKRARVWINSNYLGQHAYGYTSFSFDISEFVRPGLRDQDVRDVVVGVAEGGRMGAFRPHVVVEGGVFRGQTCASALCGGGHALRLARLFFESVQVEESQAHAVLFAESREPRGHEGFFGERSVLRRVFP